MRVRFLLDENLSPRLPPAIERYSRDIGVLRVGDDHAPPLGTLDPDILQYLEIRLPRRSKPPTAPYDVQALGEPDGDVWRAWLELAPLDGGSVLEADQETTRPSRGAIAYWATSLEEVYLEDAFDRARRRAVAASSTTQRSGSISTP